jgi:hypothetical protein
MATELSIDEVRQGLTEILEETLVEGSMDWEIISVGPNKDDWNGEVSWSAEPGSLDSTVALTLNACPQTQEVGEPYKNYKFKVKISLELVSVTDEVAE